MALIILDTESNACVPNQICQLSYLTVDGGEVAGHNHFYAVDEMNPHAEQVHGFSMARLKALSGGRRFEDDADAVISELLSADRVVGHNVSHDLWAMQDALKPQGIHFAPKSIVCTMKFFAPIMGLIDTKGKKKPPKLKELCLYFELKSDAIQEATERYFGECGRAHDARYDATATYLCLKAADEAGQLKGLLR